MLNVNAVGITQRLWTDAPLRAAVADGAATASTAPAAGDPLQRLNDEYRRLEASRLPLGWSKETRQSPGWVALCGWAVTVLPISMGAPFWFDVLTRAARLRGARDKPHDTSAQ